MVVFFIMLMVVILICETNGCCCMLGEIYWLLFLLDLIDLTNAISEAIGDHYSEQDVLEDNEAQCHLEKNLEIASGRSMISFVIYCFMLGYKNTIFPLQGVKI